MKKKLHIPSQDNSYISFSAITITTEKDISQLKKTLSFKDLSCLLDLYKKAEISGKKELKELQKLHQVYENEPEILNLLAYFFLRQRKKRKANQCIIKNYQNNPDHLLTKINYADYCLRKNQNPKIPKIFNNTFDLKCLYPHRSCFHLIEFRGFMVIMTLYHLAIGKKNEAESYFYFAHKIDPKHPSTLFAKKKLLYLPFYKKWFSSFSKRV